MLAKEPPPRKLTGKEICVIVWPSKVTDKVLGAATVLEYTNRKLVELFIARWMQGSNTILSLDAMINGSTAVSRNGDFVLAVKKCSKEYGKVWARNNHPNPNMRRSR